MYKQAFRVRWTCCKERALWLALTDYRCVPLRFIVHYHSTGDFVFIYSTFSLNLSWPSPEHTNSSYIQNLQYLKITLVCIMKFCWFHYISIYYKMYNILHVGMSLSFNLWNFCIDKIILQWMPFTPFTIIWKSSTSLWYFSEMLFKKLSI